MVEDDDSLTLSDIKSKYGQDCYDEIIKTIELYSKPLDKEHIDVFKSIVDMVEDAYSIMDSSIYNKDGDYMFTTKSHLPLDGVEYVLQEEIDKYESANRK